VHGLAAEQATTWIVELRRRGVLPAPSERQRAEVERLLGLRGLSLTEAAAVAGLERVGPVRTQGEASAIIDVLRARVAEVSEPSEKQRRYAVDLAKTLGLTEAEACGRVGFARFDQLTGGRDGSMSRLILILEKDVPAKRGGGAPLRSMARLANAAAHEINNPLTLILGRLVMLRDDPILGPEVRDRIAQIHAAAERIREIVVDMNHLTRVQLFEHTGRGLPEMLEIRRSAGESGDAGTPPATP